VSTNWERIYETTWEGLVRFLDRKVWDSERARDLAQETFVRALSTDASIDNPRAWLFTVAGNLARDEARSVGRKRRHLELIKAEAADEVEEAGGTDRMELESRRDEVRGALSRLTERDREVLLLWDAGLSYEEIAEQAGLSRGAIGTTLARARRRLIEAHSAGSKEDHVAHN
jgi:RNA polymerase sigma factor (sigma-70 family)